MGYAHMSSSNTPSSYSPRPFYYFKGDWGLCPQAPAGSFTTERPVRPLFRSFTWFTPHSIPFIRGKGPLRGLPLSFTPFRFPPSKTQRPRPWPLEIYFSKPRGCGHSLWWPFGPVKIKPTQRPRPWPLTMEISQPKATSGLWAPLGPGPLALGHLKPIELAS